VSRPKHVQNFESSIERIGKILSNKFGIKIVFKDGGAKTDGKTIQLPPLPDDAPPELFTAMNGNLDHEAAHIIFTDFSVNSSKSLSYTEKVVLNHLEDPRIERKIGELWAGTIYNIQTSLEWYLKKATEPDPKTGQSIFDKFTDDGKTIYASAIYTQKNFDDNHWFIKDVVPSHIMDRIRSVKDILKAALNAEDTKELVPLTKEYISRLNIQDIPEPEQQASGGQEGEDGDEGEDGEPREYTLGDQDLQNGSLKNILSQSVDQAVANSKEYLVYSTEHDEFVKVRDGSRSEYKRFSESMGGPIATMKRKMANSLVSERQVAWEGDKRRGYINNKALHSLAMGTSDRVFRQKVISPSFDTAVEMMVDHSGSMQGTKMKLAMQSVIVMSEVLNLLNIPFSILGFSTGSTFNDRKNSNDSYTRYGSLWTGVYKDYDEPWAKVNHRVINMSQNVKNNSYDGESVRLGTNRLLVRPEKRKILFWFNDGEPCPTHVDDGEAAVAYCKKSAEQSEKLVELIAFGITTESVKHFYKNYVVVNQINDLPASCLNKLEQLLQVTKKVSFGKR
jgi:hypothetical protein